MIVRHGYVSPVADGGDPNQVGPDEWNADHEVTFSGCRVVLDTSITLAGSNTAVPLAFDTSIYDTDDYWKYGVTSTAGDEHFFEMPLDGYYQAVVMVRFFEATALTATNHRVNFHEWGPVLDGSIQTYAHGGAVNNHTVVLVQDFYAPAGQEIDILVDHDGTNTTYAIGRVGTGGAGRYVTSASFRYLGG